MSADAFAASVARGAAVRPRFGGAIRGGLVFGLVEAVTPLLGWAIGIFTATFIAAIDHWVAFVILGTVGGRMIWEALHNDGQGETAPPPSGLRGLIALVAVAIGTSIDAAAVGVSLALIGENILIIAACIGLATFIMTTIGLSIGRVAGVRLGPIVKIFGGIALITIGTVILIEHLELLG